jgi:uncharacterized protein
MSKARHARRWLSCLAWGPFGALQTGDAAMRSFRQLLGYDDKFFAMLEASAQGAQRSVHLLGELIKDAQGATVLDNLVQARRNGKRIAEDITEQLCRTFVTPLDREDIAALSAALYKIPKTAEKFSEIFLLCRNSIGPLDFSRQLNIIEQATSVVVEMVTKLRHRADLNLMKDHNNRLHYLEGEADKLMQELIRDMYSGKHDPLRVIVTLDLYEILERVVDRCRDAGNVIFQVVLKYS